MQVSTEGGEESQFLHTPELNFIKIYMIVNMELQSGPQIGLDTHIDLVVSSPCYFGASELEVHVSNEITLYI